MTALTGYAAAPRRERVQFGARLACGLVSGILGAAAFGLAQMLEQQVMTVWWGQGLTPPDQAYLTEAIVTGLPFAAMMAVATFALIGRSRVHDVALLGLGIGLPLLQANVLWWEHSFATLNPYWVAGLIVFALTMLGMIGLIQRVHSSVLRSERAQEHL